MRVIHARNVNDAYYFGAHLVSSRGVRSASRNGPVLRIPEPVATVYEKPTERVLFDARRNANPFFHLFEALWMLNGQNDVATMDQFLRSFKQFSDDGVSFHGAYGHRWRHWPDYASGMPYTKEIDQIAQAVVMLNADASTRRVVIVMWDPVRDLGADSKDIPCNDLIKLSIREGALQMIVFCRSNDIIFGAYGANAVHMSVLHEYIAAMVGVPVGSYTQISDDFHAYLESPYNLGEFYPPHAHIENPYGFGGGEREVGSYPLVHDCQTFDAELREVMSAITSRTFGTMDLESFTNSFFRIVAQPMYQAFTMYRAGDLGHAIERLKDIQALSSYDIDWFLAAEMWLQRVLEKRMASESPTRDQIMILNCSACGKDHTNLPETREVTHEESIQGFTWVVRCPETGTEVIGGKPDLNPDGANAPALHPHIARFIKPPEPDREASRR